MLRTFQKNQGKRSFMERFSVSLIVLNDVSLG